MRAEGGGSALSGVLSCDSDACLRRARSGDDRAFQALVEQLSPAVEGALLRFLHRDAEAASAALQDAWTAAFQELSKFESVTHLRCWLHRVAKCRAISGLRKTGRLVKTPWDEVLEEADGLHLAAALAETAASDETRAAVHAAIECLPDAYRGIATLYYVHGQELREVARLVGLPTTTVKMRLHRARSRLRRQLRSTVPS
jgi:RNA polymerase sigma-70 factor (ECF subfamily)